MSRALSRSGNPVRVLLTENGKLTGDGIKTGLAQPGFYPGNSAPYDAATLDLMLPGENSLDILAARRAAGHAEPVLILTARSAIADRATGLNTGAGDYLCQPFSLDKLAARPCQTQLPRTGANTIWLHPEKAR